MTPDDYDGKRCLAKSSRRNLARLRGPRSSAFDEGKGRGKLPGGKRTSRTSARSFSAASL